MILPVTLVVFALYVTLIISLVIGICITIYQVKGNISEDITGVSVVVAFRNEAENLPRLLNALQSQALPVDRWEVIFVDDGSVDGGDSIVNSFDGKFNFRVIRQNADIAGKKHAIINGVNNTKFNLVVITDADCIPSETWLQSIVQMAGDYTLVQGAVVVESQKSVVAMFDALDYASLMAVSAGSLGLGHPVIAASANLSFRKHLVNVDSKTLRADIASGDDMFLLHAVKQNRDSRLTFNFSRHGIVRTRFDGGFSQMIQRRKRWASKSSSYRDFDTILVGFIVLVFNLWLIVLLLMYLLGKVPFVYPAAGWLLKSTVDFPLLFIYLKHTDQLKLMPVFIPLQVIYPIYISYSALAGLLGGQNWKGRKIN